MFLFFFCCCGLHQRHTGVTPREANFFLFLQVDCSLFFAVLVQQGCCFFLLPVQQGLQPWEKPTVLNCCDRKGMWLLLIFRITVLYLCFFLTTPLALFLMCCFFGQRAKCMFLESRNQISGFSRNFKHCFWISVLYYIFFRNISTIVINSIIRNILIVFHYYVVWVFFIKSRIFGCSLGLFCLVRTLFYVVPTTIT